MSTESRFRSASARGMAPARNTDHGTRETQTAFEWLAKGSHRKEKHHGTFREGKHFDPREHQRPGGPRGRSGKNDQASHPRHGESVFAGEDTAQQWMRKAEIAVDKTQDDLARAALDRFQTSQRLAQSYREQVDDQKAQVETLKGALVKLEQKLDEAKSKRDLLIARHRRSIALGKAAHAQTVLGDNSKSATFDRLKDRVHHTEAVATAEVELLSDDVGEKLTRLDRDAEVDRLLADLKARRGLPEKIG